MEERLELFYAYNYYLKSRTYHINTLVEYCLDFKAFWRYILNLTEIVSCEYSFCHIFLFAMPYPSHNGNCKINDIKVENSTGRI